MIIHDGLRMLFWSKKANGWISLILIKHVPKTTFLKEECWIDPIIQYLQIEELIHDSKEAMQLSLKASRFTLYEEMLYKKRYHIPLLRCLTLSKADYILKEVHEGVC